MNKSVFVRENGLPQSSSKVSFAGTSKMLESIEAIPIVKTIIAVLTVERLIDLSLFKRLIIKTKITLIKITTGI